MLGSKKIFLRPIEKSDLKQIQVWRNSSEVLPYVREYRLLSEQHIEKWYDTMILNDRFEMFVMVDDKEPIGICGLTYINWQNRHADLHFAIYKDLQWIDDLYSIPFFRLISRYAFNELNMNKIYVEVYQLDYKKIKFFKELHFKEDAVLREHYYHNGKYYSSHILSLLKEEYLKHQE